MQTTKDLLAARKETLVRMLGEAARKGASLVMRGYYARAARVGEDMEPLEKELDEVERKITEAAGRKKTVNGGSLERVVSRVDLAILANGGGDYDEKSCECDASVNQAPCRYCAIRDALNETLRYLRAQAANAGDERRGDENLNQSH